MSGGDRELLFETYMLHAELEKYSQDTHYHLVMS